jgi:hypothetical protein
MGVDLGEGEAMTTVGAVGVTDDSSSLSIGTSTMRGPVDGPGRWVVE